MAAERLQWRAGARQGGEERKSWRERSGGRSKRRGGVTATTRRRCVASLMVRSGEFSGEAGAPSL